MSEVVNLGIETFPSDEQIIEIYEHYKERRENTKHKKNWNEDDKLVLIWIVGKLTSLRHLDLRNIV